MSLRKIDTKKLLKYLRQNENLAAGMKDIMKSDKKLSMWYAGYEVATREASRLVKELLTETKVIKRKSDIKR